MDSTLPHFEGLTGTLIGPLMDARRHALPAAAFRYRATDFKSVANSDLTMMASGLMMNCCGTYACPENASKYQLVTAAGLRQHAASLIRKRRILRGIDSHCGHNNLQKGPLRNVSFA